MNPDNLCVVRVSLLTWTVEDVYIKTLGGTQQGSMAYNDRLALGSLVIKERLGLSDVETFENILGNPSLQYFI